MIPVLLVAASLLHPLGNFTVNRYDGLVVAPGEVRVDHVQDYAEIPTAQVGTGARAGLSAWSRDACARAARDLRLTVDGRPAAVTVRSSTAWTRPGQAGLPTLRLECRMTASLPPLIRDGTRVIGFRDGGAARPGWHEVTARGDRMTLTASDVPRRSPSARLTSYPRDMLSSPLDRRGATLRVRTGGPAAAEPGAAAPPRLLPRGADRLTRAFTSLVAHRRLTPGFAALAVLIAFALGALHALAPGHGKTIMAAQAAGRGRRSARDVLALGATVTVTHTAGVLALGVLVAGGSAVAPAELFPWLGAASGVLVVAAGVTLLRRALLGHAHAHTHGHGHGDATARSHGHERDHAVGTSRSHDRRRGRAEGSGHAKGHEHGHGHPRGRAGEHMHGGPDGDRRHGAGRTRGRPRGGARLRRLPGSGGGARYRRGRGGVVLMGLAGGLVPSPSAVVVLVGGGALGHAWFGALLVLAYGAGLAAMLVSVGLFVIGSGRFLARRLLRGRRLLPAAAVPAGTAALIVVLGVGLTVRGLVAI